MRALIQRVTRAAVRVDGAAIASIGPGLCVFVAVAHADDERSAERLAEKVWRLRVFDDDAGVMNRSLADTGGAALVVSQFTLYGDASRGHRPSWVAAARPDVARPVVERFCEALAECGAAVAAGRFGADMEVELVNDGPVTVTVEV
jgi:D-aminoacyl-tRNA deacylase